ncbi:MAG TPA: family 1 glycosylhydrolase [Actinomycetales bacterium]|nr:family 1 glycosylhydrolase [Actinomycetales bacterium]
MPATPSAARPFVWGAATSSAQIEGDRAGRGDSIWDMLAAQPGRILDGSDLDVACDHVHRHTEDVGLLADLGVDAYRFSIAWPRVLPDGTGRVSAQGLDFYDRLVDTLAERGIEPWVTLYHWDLPLALHERGGWPNRDVVSWFVEYTEAVHARLGDRVTHWGTLNEPWCSAWLGYGSGEHAPGERNHERAWPAMHHLLLAHGTAVSRLRELSGGSADVGIVLNLFGVHPVDDASPAVKQAVEHVDVMQNRVWLDALLRSQYGDAALELAPASFEDVVHDGDLQVIGAPLDWLGVNYYADLTFEAKHSGADERDPEVHREPRDATAAHDLEQDIDTEGALSREAHTAGAYPGADAVTASDPGPEGTTMRWPVTPSGLTGTLQRITREWPAPPLVVTENGAAFVDDVVVTADGVAIDDPRRAHYLVEHVAAVQAASAAGVDVRGYFAWSLLDNFEWAWGYTQAFGIVHVDRQTQVRTPKASFATYARLVQAARGA